MKIIVHIEKYFLKCFETFVLLAICAVVNEASVHAVVQLRSLSYHLTRWHRYTVNKKTIQYT